MGPGEKILHALHAKSFATILVGVVTELTETYLFKHNEVSPALLVGLHNFTPT